MDKQVRPFGMRDKIGYMFGDFGNDFTFILSSAFMLKFYTDVMGIGAGVVGMLMMAARFLDAFTDITMGQIVDRSKPGKDGKFRPWIRRMCGPVAISSFLIYQSAFAGMPYWFKVGWMVVTYILWGSIFYTAVNIPYGSMASAISAEAKDRAQLSTWRTVGATLAGLVIGAGTPMLAYVTVEGQTVLSGFRMTVIAGVFSVLSFLCYLLCVRLTAERVEVPASEGKIQFTSQLKNLMKNQALLGIIAAAMFLLLALLGMQGISAYVFPEVYNSAKAQSMFSLLTSLAVLGVCAPLATRLSVRYGKRELSAFSCLFGAVILFLCMVIYPKNEWVYVGFFVLAYIGIGFFNTVIWAMITDVIDDAEVKNKVREDGTVYSLYSFARKLGQALSSGLVGTILAAVGYQAQLMHNPQGAEQIARRAVILDRIFQMSCLIPAIGLFIVAMILLFIYPLSKKKVNENIAELEKRRNS